MSQDIFNDLSQASVQRGAGAMKLKTPLKHNSWCGPEEADVFPGRILAFVNMVTVSWSINVSLLQISPLLSEEQ